MPSYCACGGQLSRVHRTFLEKLAYMAIYRCKACGSMERRPRRYMFYFQGELGCPLCRTKKLRRLTAPDHIDPMRWNLYNWLRWAMAVQLYHCRYCRIQFYDRLHAKNEVDSGAPA